MTTKQLEDAAWLKHPHTFRNNRGVFQVIHTDKNGKRKTRWIRCGIPDPKGREKDTDKKGGDRIGWTEVAVTPEMVGTTLAVFTNVEIKGPGDTLKPGQKDFHNLVLRHGGISKIWYEDKIIDGRIDD